MRLASSIVPCRAWGFGGVALDVNHLRMSCNARLRVLIARCVCCVTNPCVIWLEGPDLEICQAYGLHSPDAVTRLHACTPGNLSLYPWLHCADGVAAFTDFHVAYSTLCQRTTYLSCPTQSVAVSALQTRFRSLSG